MPPASTPVIDGSRKSSVLHVSLGDESWYRQQAPRLIESFTFLFKWAFQKIKSIAKASAILRFTFWRQAGTLGTSDCS